MNKNDFKKSDSKSKIEKSLDLYGKIDEIEKEIKRLESLAYEKAVLKEQLSKADANNFSNLKARIKNLEEEIEKAPLLIEALKKQQEACEKSLETHLRDEEYEKSLEDHLRGKVNSKCRKNAKNPKTSSRDK